MWMTVRECLDQVAQFDDTQELAAKLREMADAAEPADAYFLREAATNMQGMAHLMRSMAGRLQNATAAMPAPAAVASPPPTATPAAEDGGPLLDLPRVLAKIGVGRSQWLDFVRDGKAPQPVRLGRRTLWPEAEIAAWVADRIAQHRTPKN